MKTITVNATWSDENAEVLSEQHTFPETYADAVELGIPESVVMSRYNASKIITIRSNMKAKARPTAGMAKKARSADTMRLLFEQFKADEITADEYDEKMLALL